MVFLAIAAVAVWIAFGSIALAHRATHPRGGSMGRALAHGRPTDPGEAGLLWTVETWRGHGGLELPLWRIEGPDDAGHTLIRLHDWGESPIDALSSIEQDLNGARAVLLPTLRGHDDAPGRCTLGRDEAADLQALIQQVEGEIVLAGTGLGG
ncbi:MAG: hypothetical protein MK101_08905, partial [Phycisphaerales bacterium]|nr:hypothetical protein [Phycisphaerales bacterium]